MKKCGKCKVEKEIDGFYNNRTTKDGKHNQCKTCMNLTNKKTPERQRIDSKNYSLRNPEKIKATWKSYYERNKELLAEKAKNRVKSERVIETIKNYKINNKEKILAKRKFSRENPTIQQALRKKLRDRFHKVIIRMKSGTRHKSCINLLGCDFDKLKEHIESQFSEGMNWQNHGNFENKWNIDHIRPLCTFDLHSLKEQEIAFHYTNLRPLWFIDNMKRGRKNWQKTA